MASQSPEVIRASIEETRRELAENRNTALVGAAVAGFVIGGGVAATFSLLSGRRRGR
jgi:hypothetical protein